MQELRPDLMAGAPPSVVTAAARARQAAEAAWLVLGDQDLRRRYDMKAADRPLDGDLADSDAWRSFQAVKDWIAPPPAASRGRAVVPDLRGLFYRPCRAVVTAAGLRLEVVRLTPDPLPVEGLVVGQAPDPGTRVRRSSSLTVNLWHPPRRHQPPARGPVNSCVPAPVRKTVSETPVAPGKAATDIGPFPLPSRTRKGFELGT